MKTFEVWEALQEYYKSIKPGDNKKAYFISPKIVAPILGFRPVDGQLKIIVKSMILCFDMEAEFEARIELYQVCTSIGSYTDFPLLPEGEIVNLDMPAVGEINLDDDLSYHDVAVYCGSLKYVISDNYAYHLSCSRTGGWSLWYKWAGEEKLLGEEFGGEPFCVTVAGIPIVGQVPLEE